MDLSLEEVANWGQALGLESGIASCPLCSWLTLQLPGFPPMTN